MVNRNTTAEEDTGAEVEAEIATGNTKDDAMTRAVIGSHTGESTGISDQEDIRPPARGPFVAGHALTLLQIQGMKPRITVIDAETDRLNVETGGSVGTTMTEDAMKGREQKWAEALNR